MSQYTLPEISTKLAYQANRASGAERFPEPAVHQSIAVDLALIDTYDRLLTDLELALVQTAKMDPQEGRCDRTSFVHYRTGKVRMAASYSSATSGSANAR